MGLKRVYNAILLTLALAMSASAQVQKIDLRVEGMT